MAADGSVLIEFDANASPAEKELAKLKRKIQEAEEAAYQDTAKRDSLQAQTAQAATNLDEAKRTLYEMKNASKGAFSSEVIADQRERVRGLQTEYNQMENSVDRLNQRIATSSDDVAKMRDRAGELQQHIDATTSSSSRMREAMGMARKSLDKFTSRVKRLAQRVFIFTLITTALRGIRTWMGDVLKTSDETKDAISKLKGALLTLAQPLVDVIIPAATTLINVLTRMVNVLSATLSRLFGTTSEESAKAAEALYEEQKGLEDVGEAAEETKGNLAGFDEINMIGNEQESDSGTTNSTEILPDFSQAGDMSWLSTTLGKATDWVTGALLLGGIALVAIGACTGSLGAVLTGLIALGAGIVIGDETGVIQSWVDTLGLKNVEEFVTSALLLGGIALVALGAIFGNISLIVAGLGLLAAGVVVGMESNTLANWADVLGLNSVFDYVAAAIQLGGIAIAAIGAAMANPYMVFAGLGILGLGMAAEMIGEETLKNWWETLKLTTVRQWVTVALQLGGIALIAIGAILHNIPMVIAGLGLIGFSAITSTDEGNLGNWADALGLGKVMGWVTAGLMLAGLALVVFGICTANIAMVLAGVGLLGSGVMVGIQTGTFASWINTIVTGLKSLVKSIQEKVIDPIVNAFKGLYNNVVGIIEGMVNGFIGIINAFIRGINLVISTINKIPGVNISTLSTISTVSIPRLAQGAVIPPNREFMAVLGDQKSGNNIEAPEELIRRIVREESGGNADILRQILQAIKEGKVMVVDRQVLARVTVRGINDLTIQAGKSVLKV